MPYNEHTEFDTPPSNTVIWRFLDFPKFISLLSTKSLRFTQAAKLQAEDPYEGTLRNLIYAISQKQFGDLSEREKQILRIRSEEHFTGISEMCKILQFDNERTSQQMFINSWHINDHESAAMWKLYGLQNQGVAIKTTCGSLINSLKAYCQFKIFIGRINYIDYDEVGTVLTNVFAPFLWKRKSFEHENELRALIWGVSEGSSVKDRAKYKELFGLDVSVDLQSLIQEIYISPTAERWHSRVVQDLLDIYNLKIKVHQSSLYDRWGSLE